MFNWFKKSEVKNKITFDYSSIIVDTTLARAAGH